MKKRALLSTGIVIGVIFLITALIIGLNIIRKKDTYKKGIECFNNKSWTCVIEKFTNLNYKDSNEKLKTAQYNHYLILGQTELNNKSYKKALSQYKNASALKPNDEELKIKRESIESIVEKQKKEEAINRKKQEEENKINAIKSKISDTAINPIPTKFGEGYDETIKRYGVPTINRINKLAPKVAELVAQNPKCTRVMTVDVADDKSTRNSITFFVDCGDINHIADIQRYYVNEKEVNANVIPKSVKEQGESIDNVQYIQMCEAEIKARLNYPSTFNPSIMSSSVYKATMNTVVTIPFKAKNAFNLELKHKGICYYNGASLTDIEINEEQR